MLMISVVNGQISLHHFCKQQPATRGVHEVQRAMIDDLKTSTILSIKRINVQVINSVIFKVKSLSI